MGGILRTLSRAQAKEWCESRSLHLRNSGLPDFVNDARYCVEIAAPTSTARATYLAYFLLRLFMTSEEEYEGSLLILDRWDTRGPPIGEAYHRIFRAIEGVTQEESLLGAARAREFAPTELAEAIAQVSLVLWFQWDGLLFPTKGNYAVIFTDDERIYLISDDTQLLRQAERDVAHEGFETRWMRCPWVDSRHLELLE